jgi:hypothetical protein
MTCTLETIYIWRYIKNYVFMEAYAVLEVASAMIEIY